MTRSDPGAPLAEHPHILRGMAILAIGGCAAFALLVLVADFVVPDHDWIADTISDLGAGRYEFIADAGIYAFSAALLACAVGASHAHLGGRGWSYGIYALIVTGMVVFLVGARDEYGDGDREGFAIHIYLVYVLGATFASMPWAMSAGAGMISTRLKWVLRAVTIIWVPTAPYFLFMGTGRDGLYERMLGGITFVFVIALALVFLGRARATEARASG